MFVRTLAELEKWGRIRISADTPFRSERFVTAADGIEFSHIENRLGKSTGRHLLSITSLPLAGDEHDGGNGGLPPQADREPPVQPLWTLTCMIQPGR